MSKRGRASISALARAIRSRRDIVSRAHLALAGVVSCATLAAGAFAVIVAVHFPDDGWGWKQVMPILASGVAVVLVAWAWAIIRLSRQHRSAQAAVVLGALDVPWLYGLTWLVLTFRPPFADPWIGPYAVLVFAIAAEATVVLCALSIGGAGLCALLRRGTVG